MMINQFLASGGLWLNLSGTEILIDPGPGCIVQATKRKLKADKLSAIILSHRHLDHSADVNIMVEAMTRGGFRRHGWLFAPTDALEAEPDLVVALLGRASARASLGNTVGAVTDLTRVIELEPENADTLALRGDRNVELQDYRAAERDYERAMEIAGQTPSMVVRYLFALSRSRDLMHGSGEEPQPLDDRDLETEPVGSPDRSSSAGPVFDWLSRLLSPHPWQPTVTALLA